MLVDASARDETVWAGRSEMVSSPDAFFGFCARLRCGGELNLTFYGSGYIWQGNSESSHGSPRTTAQGQSVCGSPLQTKKRER